jgi:hypothetical protein
MIINNYSFKGYPGNFFAEHMPSVVVGNKMAELFRNCPLHNTYMHNALVADNLEAAVNFAYRATGTRNVIIFDGAKDGINATSSLIQFLLEKAPHIGEEVEEEYMPKWLRQRGLERKIPIGLNRTNAKTDAIRYS